VVAVTANRTFHPFTIEAENLLHAQPVRNSPFTMNCRSVEIFHDLTGFAVGSVEGRCTIQFFDSPERNFTFKCHREEHMVYSVNGISYNKNNTFVTVGSDGGMHYWDHINRQRLRQVKKLDLPITACAFQLNFFLVALVIGDDWSQGSSTYEQNGPLKPSIFIRQSEEKDVTMKNNNR
jgi:mRNA export factor